MRRLGLVVAVIVALVVGRLITDHVPLAASASRPFVHDGSVGHVVHLSYADVDVTDIRAAHGLTTTDQPVAAAGVFLIVDLELTARHQPTSFLGVDLRDPHGTRYVPTTRADCAVTPRSETGVPTYAMFCFDVPTTALAGMSVVVARGSYDVDGSGQRRDDEAHVDLGIDAAKATAMGATTMAYRGEAPSFQPLDTTPVTVTF